MNFMDGGLPAKSDQRKELVVNPESSVDAWFGPIDFGLEEPHEPAANAQAVVGKIRKRLGVNCPVWNEILRVRAGRRLRN